MRVLQLHTDQGRLLPASAAICAARSTHLHAARAGEQLNRLVAEAAAEEKTAPVRGSAPLGSCVALPADGRMPAKFCSSSTRMSAKQARWLQQFCYSSTLAPSKLVDGYLLLSKAQAWLDGR
jgi:hypothetical protein